MGVVTMIESGPTVVIRLAGMVTSIVVGMLLSLLEFVLWVVLMIKAYQGQKFKLPVIGDMAEQQAGA